MDKILYILIVLFFIGCGDHDLPTHSDTNSNLALDDRSEYFLEPKMAIYQLSANHDGVLVASTFTLALSCDNVYGTGQNGDWSQNNVAATTSVSLPASKNCRITLSSYCDASDTCFNPVLTSLVTTVSTTGTITSGSATQYTASGNIKQWFYSSQAGSYSIQYNYAADAITATTSITPTVINIQTVSLAIASITPPTVSNLTLYSLGAINSAAATYTLIATVTGSTGCKYISNNSNTYNPASWNSVNTAYNNGSAVSCPSFTPASNGSTTDNWTNKYGGTGQKTLIMWANTVNGLTAYTTANF